MISEVKPKLEELGVNIIAVANSDVGLTEFVEGYFTGPVYVDDSLGLFAQCADKMSTLAMTHALTVATVRLPGLISKGISGNVVVPSNSVYDDVMSIIL